MDLIFLCDVDHDVDGALALDDEHPIVRQSHVGRSPGFNHLKTFFNDHLHIRFRSAFFQLFVSENAPSHRPRPCKRNVKTHYEIRRTNER